MTGSTSGRSRAVQVAMWAQRRSHVIPAPARRVAGRALRRFAGRTRRPVWPSEDWTVSLVAGRGGADLAALAGIPLADTDPPVPAASPLEPAAATGEPSTGTGPLRCAIAVGVLDAGGAEEFAGFLARGLPRHGLQTVLVCESAHRVDAPGEPGRLAARLDADGIAYVRLSAGTAADFLREYRPDVLSAHYSRDWLLDAATELGVPWVETLHGMHSFYHPQQWRPEQRRARRISAQIAVSELVRRQYLTRNPRYPTDRIVTVPNGVDRHRLATVDRAAARAALGLRDEFLFVSLQRYCLQKNTYGLVSAFAEVAAAHPDAHLLVAGRADDELYFGQAQSLARSLPCADRIHLRGHCANVPALLAAADGFVLDSFFEGWALSSMEALASGVPVVLSQVGGAAEQLAGDGLGYLVDNPAGDAEAVHWLVMSDLRFRRQSNRAALVRAMRRLIDERDHWAADREALAERALARFSAPRCLARHAAILRDVARGNQHGPIPVG
jgi:glycosyltransferase involved in cell wall biosynthesis